MARRAQQDVLGLKEFVEPLVVVGNEIGRQLTIRALSEGAVFQCSLPSPIHDVKEWED